MHVFRHFKSQKRSLAYSSLRQQGVGVQTLSFAYGLTQIQKIPLSTQAQTITLVPAKRLGGIFWQRLCLALM
jgi:hypothetical protein